MHRGCLPDRGLGRADQQKQVIHRLELTAEEALNLGYTVLDSQSFNPPERDFAVQSSK